MQICCLRGTFCQIFHNEIGKEKHDYLYRKRRSEITKWLTLEISYIFFFGIIYVRLEV